MQQNSIDTDSIIEKNRIMQSKFLKRGSVSEEFDKKSLHIRQRSAAAITNSRRLSEESSKKIFRYTSIASTTS